MADGNWSVVPEFVNSPFGVMRKSRMRRGTLHKPPPNTEGNSRVYGLLIEHLLGLCREKGVPPSHDVGSAVPLTFGRGMRLSQSWETLIRDFEQKHPDIVGGDEAIRLSIAFARGRISAMQKAEHDGFVRVQLENGREARQRQYANERAANGGERDFFDSNAWQRLRFEVLAESEGCCVLCGRSYREHGVAIEVDHIKPRSRFPALALVKDNLQVMCFDCNRGKSNRDTTDWRTGAENDDDPQERVA
jgi:hypothetical protein